MPRPDGKPTIAEMLAEGEDDEEVKAILLTEGVEAANEFRDNHRRNKFWPPEED